MRTEPDRNSSSSLGRHYILSRRTLETMRIQLLLAWFLLSCTSFLPAQRWQTSATNQLSPEAPLPLEDMAHMSWVRRDGAPSDITALAQTKDGYLWIGSRWGLFRFDGLQFSTYPFTSADPQLLSSDIAALAADANGGVWIGYRMGGMTYLRGDRKVDYDNRAGLVSESTEQLFCHEDGSVWAIADGWLMHLAGSTWGKLLSQARTVFPGTLHVVL
jgi:hypothetical protein